MMPEPYSGYGGCNNDIQQNPGADEAICLKKNIRSDLHRG